MNLEATLKWISSFVNQVTRTKTCSKFSHFACCRQRPIFALNVLEEYGAELGNHTNENGANQLHFLFCPFSECTDFENIFKTMEYLQVKLIS